MNGRSGASKQPKGGASRRPTMPSGTCQALAPENSRAECRAPDAFGTTRVPTRSEVGGSGAGDGNEQLGRESEKSNEHTCTETQRAIMQTKLQHEFAGK